MKNYLLLLSFLSTLANAQINRFFYEYKYIPDSNNKTDVKTEIMHLDIDKNGSSYYSRQKFINDSMAKADMEKQMSNASGGPIMLKNKPADIEFKVTKQYPDFKTYLFKNITRDRYKIKEDQKPEWKILPDKQKIGDYNVQKAVTGFGGREWTAWFTTTIPFQDGPYTLYGLPGLIVKIEDSTGSHIMTLVGNKKVQETPVSENRNFPFDNRKEIEVTKTQFKKVWKDYISDPAKEMRNNSGTFKAIGSDGKEIDPKEAARDFERYIKEKLAKDNNPIEPDLVN